jgi:predicted DNA-binding protein
MPMISIRLTEEERRILARRSREAGMRKATFVRSLIRERPIETGADLLADHERFMGDPRMRIRVRK